MKRKLDVRFDVTSSSFNTALNIQIRSFGSSTFVYNSHLSPINVIIICRFMPTKKYMEVSLHAVPTALVTNPEKEELKS